MPKPYYLSLDTTSPEDYEPPYELWSAMSLTQIADAHKTDKGTLKHNYTQHYERYFKEFRVDPYEHATYKPLALLEIGVACGASLKMWSRYFPHAKIVGVDINPMCASLCKEYENIEIIIQNAADQAIDGQWDIVIDDGSHVAAEMRWAFRLNWPKVNPGGYYCIEDTGCTLPSRNYHRPLRLEGEEERKSYDGILSVLAANTDMGNEIEFVHMYRELVIIRKLPNHPVNGSD